MAEMIKENKPAANQHIVVAMSGGVDSSVAAAILCEQGYQVSGIMMRLYDSDSGEDIFARSLTKARKVSELLNISFQVIDFRQEFKKKIINYYLESHHNGRTPNPCFICNRQIKWGLLLDFALKQGINWLASGHYARITSNPSGMIELHKAVDTGKDQSYVLSGLDQSSLSHVVLPLGSLKKEQTRDIARSYNFGFNEIKDSQDLCFFNGMKQEEFLLEHAPQLFVPGEIRTPDGRKVGEHDGMANYTIGQRKGLGAGNQEPIYVLKKDIQNNVLIVGTRSELGVKKVSVTDANWINGKEPTLPDDFEVKIRYRSNPKLATLHRKNDSVYDIIFAEPVRDPTPGQFAVFYKGDQVIGSALISDTISGADL